VAFDPDGKLSRLEVDADGNLKVALTLASGQPLLNYVPYTNVNSVFKLGAGAANSDFVATIATLPGGAVLTYNAPTSGNENCIGVTVASNLGKIVLHNTTRGTEALIASVVVATNTIQLMANVPAGWQVGDTITARSQTNTGTVVAGCYFFDIDVSEAFAATVAALDVDLVFSDSGAATRVLWSHPYLAYAAPKIRQVTCQAAGVYNQRGAIVALVNQRFTLGWYASGAATAYPVINVFGYLEAAS
jgi:hypothetical protein